MDNRDHTLSDDTSVEASLPTPQVRFRPGWYVVLCSLLVLTFCAGLAGMAVAACFRTWDTRSVLGGLVLLPLPAALGWQQFRAVVCHAAQAAVGAMWMLVVLGGFILLVTLGTAASLRSQPIDVPLIVPVLLLAATLVCFGAAAANRRWARRLMEQHIRAAELGGWRWGVLLVLLAATGLATVFFVRATPPQYAEHVELASPPFGIPTGARDISFCQGAHGALAYEFNIDEAGFRQWVEHGIGAVLTTSDSAAREIQEPLLMDRYSSLLRGLEQPDAVTIVNGLYFEWSGQGRHVRAAFDAATRRAYYWLQVD